MKRQENSSSCKLQLPTDQWGAEPKAEALGRNINTTTRSAGVGPSGPPRTLEEVARVKVTIWHPERTPSSGRACRNIPATCRREVLPLLPKPGEIRTGFTLLRAGSSALDGSHQVRPSPKGHCPQLLSSIHRTMSSKRAAIRPALSLRDPQSLKD